MFRFLIFVSLMCTPLVRSSPEVGDIAPPFELLGSDGERYTLEQFLGKKPVVVAWYPKAFTGG